MGGKRNSRQRNVDDKQVTDRLTWSTRLLGNVVTTVVVVFLGF